MATNQKPPVMNRKSKAHQHLQRGFSLLELTIAMGVIGVTMLAFGGFSQLSSEYQNKVKNRNDLFQVKSEILRTVGSQPNWYAMITKAGTDALGTGHTINDELMCIRDGTVCTTGDHNLTVLRADGTLFLDSANQSVGYTRQGVACQTYGASEAAGCDNRYTVTWSPICPVSGPCIRPQVVVRLSFTSTDANSTLTSMLGAQIPLDALIEQQRVQRPLVRRIGGYTNSPVVYAAESPIVINPLTSVVGAYNPVVTPFAAITTANNGTVTYVSASQVRYQPAADFYGTDYFSYPVKDLSTGKVMRGNVTMRVMTPYTWTGLAGGGLSSTIGNFCGKVVNGICDGATFPANTWTVAHANLVFDNTCTSCNAVIDGVGSFGPMYGYQLKLNSIELESTYRGTVRLAKTMILADAIGPRMIPVNLLVAGGTFDASGVDKFGADAGARQWGSPPPIAKDYAVKVSGSGRFLSALINNVNGAVYLEGPASFVHRAGGFFNVGGIWGRNNIFYAPNVDFNKMQFGGTNSGINISSNFNILTSLTLSPSAADDRLSNGEDPVTRIPIPNPTISLKGNLILTGRGGNHCNMFSGGCYGPFIELNGTGDQVIQGVDDSSFTLDRSTIVNNVGVAPSIRINKTAGNTKMTGVVGVRRDFAIQNIASYDFSGSKLAFAQTDCGMQSVRVPVGVKFDNFYELGQGCGGGMDYGSSDFIVRNYYMYGYGIAVYGTSYNSATINVIGDFFENGAHYHDNRYRAIRVRFSGVADQHLRRMPLPDGTTPDTMMTAMNWTVDKPSGTLYLDGRITTMGDFLVDNGAVVGNPGSALVNPGHGGNYDKTVLRAPAAQFNAIEVEHTMQLDSDIHTKNLKLGIADVWNGGGVIYAGSSKFYVSQDVEFKFPKAFINMTTPTQPNIVLDGAGAQNMSITAASGNSAFTGVNTLVAKPGGSVAYTGSGSLRRVCVNSAGFSMDPSSSMTVSDKLGLMNAGYFAQNGATVSGVIVMPDAACN